MKDFAVSLSMSSKVHCIWIGIEFLTETDIIASHVFHQKISDTTTNQIGIKRIHHPGALPIISVRFRC